MPKANSQQVITRQWETLSIIPKKRPGITVKELIDRLDRSGIDISRRTIERDLHELSRLFGITCNDKSKPYGWYWMNGSGVNLPALTLADALSLRVVEQQLRPLLPETMLDSLENRFKEASKKLSAEKDNKNADWLKKVRYKSINLQLLSPEIKKGVLETVQNALLDGKQLEVEYRRPSEENAYSTILHPLGLVQGGPTTYLIATVRDYKDTLLFAVHRILKAKKTSDGVIASMVFDIDKYIKGSELTFGSHKTIVLKAYVSQDLHNILAETPLSEDQSLKSEGDRAYLTATVEDSWQLHWWILSQGDGIKVEHPQSLKREIIKSLTTTLDLYNNE